MTLSNRLAVCLTLVGLWTTAPGVGWAQDTTDRVTVQMRNGTIVRGALEDLEDGTLYVRVSLPDQRRLPIEDVALIARDDNRAGLAGSESQAGGSPTIVLSNGRRLDATLIDIEGGAGSAAPNKPRMLIVRMPNGAERRLSAAEVDRVYFGNCPCGPETSDTPVPSGAIRVPATERWVDTGIVVREGQLVGFVTTGQVQLSADAADTASSPGAIRTAPRAPLPALGAGALIGRIGSTGQPFGIGNQSSVPMPETGRLYLAVNDDELADNRGAFDVVVTPSTPRR